MSRVRSSGSEIERLLGSAMFSLGLRYRKQYRITGKPDFAFPGRKVAVFCDSNFWHGKDWETLKGTIKTNRDFWLPKIERNIARDAEVNRTLREEGWTIIRFWEEEIKKDPVACAERVKATVAPKKSEKVFEGGSTPLHRTNPEPSRMGHRIEEGRNHGRER